MEKSQNSQILDVTHPDETEAVSVWLQQYHINKRTLYFDLNVCERLSIPGHTEY